MNQSYWSNTIPRGLQRHIRHAVKTVPFTAPYRLYASMEYSLQVGMYRQLFGKIGEISPAHMNSILV